MLANGTTGGQNQFFKWKCIFKPNMIYTKNGIFETPHNKMEFSRPPYTKKNVFSWPLLYNKWQFRVPIPPIQKVTYSRHPIQRLTFTLGKMRRKFFHLPNPIFLEMDNFFRIFSSVRYSLYKKWHFWYLPMKNCIFETFIYNIFFSFWPPHTK